MARMARDRQIGVRVNDEEMVALERASRKDRRTVSDFIRDAMMLDLMLVFDHTFMTEVRRQIRERIEHREFQRELPLPKVEAAPMKRKKSA
jgi:uncharacterized protein (DUF1778 family)